MNENLNLIDLEAIPDDLRDNIREDIRKYGESTVYWMLRMAPIKRLISEEANENDTMIWCQMTQHVINQLASKDPMPPHYIVARETLTEQEGGDYNSQDQEAVNMLAIELLRQCQIIKDIILKDTPPLEDDKGLFIVKNDLVNNSGNSILIEPPIENSMLWLDNFLLKQIASIGEEGKKLATELEPLYPDRCLKAMQENPPNFKRVWTVWVGQKETFTPPFLNVLARICWLDIIKPKWKKKNKLKIPAIPKGLWIDPIKELLTKNNQLIEQEDSIDFFSGDGRLLLKAEVATIDKNLLSLISGGLRDLSSLTGHKTYRWLIRTGFENVINGEDDARLIRTRGGYKGISDLIGCNSKDDPQKVKRILHALAFGNYKTPTGTYGTLITIEIVDKHRN